MKLSKIQTALIIIAVLALVSLAAAAYIMQSPDSDDVTVNPTPTPTATAALSKVAVNATTLYVGDYLRLSTTVSDATAGLTVTFHNNNGVVVGTAFTNSAGTATLTIQPPVGTWSFYATAEHP